MIHVRYLRDDEVALPTDERAVLLSVGDRSVRGGVFAGDEVAWSEADRIAFATMERSPLHQWRRQLDAELQRIQSSRADIRNRMIALREAKPVRVLEVRDTTSAIAAGGAIEVGTCMPWYREHVRVLIGCGIGVTIVLAGYALAHLITLALAMLAPLR